MASMFQGSRFNGDISNWDVSNFLNYDNIKEIIKDYESNEECIEAIKETFKDCPINDNYIPNGFKDFQYDADDWDEDDWDEDDDNDEEYDAYEICREIIDHYDADDWIGQSDIDNYLDEFYPNMSDDDRWFVNDRMESFVDSIDPYRSVTDDEDDEDNWDDEDDQDNEDE